MPTNTNAYNSRVTDEALEKRFRDTFRSQGGAELVDDLYAQGVIVPVVDFTQAATGDILEPNLQTAWDSSTGLFVVESGTPQTIISTAGFWQVDLTASVVVTGTGATSNIFGLDIWDGTTSKPIWEYRSTKNQPAADRAAAIEQKFVVFLRSGDSMRGQSLSANFPLTVWYRQIATVNGDLINPSGFTFS